MSKEAVREAVKELITTDPESRSALKALLLEILKEHPELLQSGAESSSDTEVQEATQHVFDRYSDTFKRLA